MREYNNLRFWCLAGMGVFRGKIEKQKTKLPLVFFQGKEYNYMR